MTKVRVDLVGVVHAYHADGKVSVLAAGDEVPDGVEVGEHIAGQEAKGYDDLKVDELKAEIDRRNEGRDEDAKIVPDAPGHKADLVAALTTDDGN